MRTFWICFGLGTQALFVVTVSRLFPFLDGQNPHWGFASWPADGIQWYWVDGLLAAQFAVIHSWLLLPRTRDCLERFIPGALYGCFFCVATCLTLLLAIELWQPSPVALWEAQGARSMAIRAAFLLTWGALFYSLHLNGLGYQTGWTPFWAWLRGRQLPRRAFQPRGAYRLLRHPVYLSFLGLVWITPTMTLDRAVLTAVWTVYVFAGSYLKDRRLLFDLGDTYRRYMARVPGYPFFLFGPLARVPVPEPACSRETRWSPRPVLAEPQTAGSR